MRSQFREIARRGFQVVIRERVGRAKSKCIIATYLFLVWKPGFGIAVDSCLFHNRFQRGKRIGGILCGFRSEKPVL